MPAADTSNATNIDSAPWHALWTRSNCERRAHEDLLARGFRSFLPMIEAWSRNGRRRHAVPMFPAYLFVHDDLVNGRLLDCLRVKGVVAVLKTRPNRLATIPEEEIESVRRIVDGRVSVQQHPYLRTGMRVRVRRGPLTGISGILLCDGPRARLVISVQLFHRSVSVNVSPDAVVPA